MDDHKNERLSTKQVEPPLVEIKGNKGWDPRAKKKVDHTAVRKAIAITTGLLPCVYCMEYHRELVWCKHKMWYALTGKTL